MQIHGFIWVKIAVVFVSIVLALGVWGCGPSQDEVERIVADAVQAERDRVANEAVAQAKGYVDAKMLEQSNYVDIRTVEVKNYVDTRAVQFENYADTRATEFSAYTDNALREHKLWTDNKALAVQEIVDKAGQEFSDMSEQTIATVREDTVKLVLSLCETDYWTLAAWSAILSLETEDPEVWWEYGVLIDDSYELRGTVCGVDDEGQWYLLEQPDKVDEVRFIP